MLLCSSVVYKRSRSAEVSSFQLNYQNCVYPSQTSLEPRDALFINPLSLLCLQIIHYLLIFLSYVNCMGDYFIYSHVFVKVI